MTNESVEDFLKKISEKMKKNPPNIEGALEIIKQALQMFAVNSDNYYMFMGIEHLINNKHEEAMLTFNKAIEINPNNYNLYRYRGIVKEDLQDYAGAIEDLNKAIELDQMNSHLYFNRGIVKDKQRDYIGAIEDYNKAIELDPNDARFPFSLGYVKAEMQNYDGAIEDYNKAIELDPKIHYYYYNRSIVKSVIQDYAGAKEDCIKAINLNPENSTYYARLNDLNSELENNNKNQDTDLQLDSDAQKALFKAHLKYYLINGGFLLLLFCAVLFVYCHINNCEITQSLAWRLFKSPKFLIPAIIMIFVKDVLRLIFIDFDQDVKKFFEEQKRENPNAAESKNVINVEIIRERFSLFFTVCGLVLVTHGLLLIKTIFSIRTILSAVCAYFYSAYHLNLQYTDYQNIIFNKTFLISFFVALCLINVFKKRKSKADDSNNTDKTDSVDDLTDM